MATTTPTTSAPEFRSVGSLLNDRHDKVVNRAPRLCSSSKLYARQVEEQALVEAYRLCIARSCPQQSTSYDFNNSIKKQPQLVLITGPSGTGKSRLAQSLRHHVQANGAAGFFISGKFDSLERPESYYPIVQAVTDLVEQLHLQKGRLDNNSGDHDRDSSACYQDRCLALEEIVSVEHLLVDMVPALGRFQTERSQSASASSIADANSNKNSCGMDAPIRLARAFCRLIKAMCSPRMPLVLFLDDIQWAKAAPLGIVRALLADTDLTQQGGFMMLAACRGNEVPMEHHLSVTLRELEATGVRVADIRLGDLDQTAVTQMVQDQLLSEYGTHEVDQLTKQLSQHIWKQANGNIFFTIQLIRKIFQNGKQGLPSTRRLKSGNIMAWHNYDTAIDLITETILSLPRDVHDILKLASCFGAEFYPPLLEELVDFDPRQALEIAEASQLISRSEGLAQQHDKEGKWRFLHDQIQQSAYSLIPEKDKEATHLEMGRRLWNELNDNELKTYGFAVVRQLRLGSSLITDEAERYRVAELLLMAGKHATKASAYDEAASHFELGISLLGFRHWRDEYFLSLDLYHSSAEVAFCRGHHESVAALTAEVISNARTNAHKLGAYIARVESLSATNQAKAALDLSLRVLADHGYRFPKKDSLVNVVFELYKTKRMLRRYTNKQIRKMTTTDDKEMLKIMKIFNLAIGYSIYCQPLFFPVIAMQAVRLSLKKGLCGGASAVPISILSFLLCSHFGDAKLGFRMAQLSLDIVSDMKAYNWQDRVYLFCHGFVLPIKEPLSKQLAPLLTAHRQGTAAGDIEIGCMCAHMYSLVGLHASIPLQGLAADMKGFQKVMEAHGQMIVLQYLLPTLQVAMNLLHRSDNPVVLTGEILNEGHFRTVLAVANPTALGILDLEKIVMSCVFGEHKVGEALALDVPNWASLGLSPFLRVAVFLYSGICHAALANNRRSRRLSLVKKNLRQLKRFVHNSDGRYNAQVHILEAEVAGIRGKTVTAVSKFQLAIDLAQEEGLHMIVGIVNERASAVLSDEGLKDEANIYLARAAKAYQVWGAVVKVEMLLSLLPADLRSRVEENKEIIS